jgi:hypothetical protein
MTDRDPTAFELLANELQRTFNFTPQQVAELHRVFSGFGGQEIHVPAARTFGTNTARDAARRMLAAGVPAHLVRDRLMRCHGMAKTKAYRLIAEARQELANC